MGIEPALQDEDGGDLVDDVLSVARASTDGIEMAVSLGGTETLIPEMDRQLEFGAQAVGKFLGRDGPGATIAGEMDRPSDDDFRAGVASQQATEGTQVIAGIGVDDGEQGLRGQPQFVGDGDADAPLAVVEAEDSAGWAAARFARAATAPRV